jgi:hypothetical protein
MKLTEWEPPSARYIYTTVCPFLVERVVNAMFHADGSGNTDRILFEIDEAWV